MIRERGFIVNVTNTILDSNTNSMISMNYQTVIYFVTNNTSKTRDEYVEKLNSYGVQASKDEVRSHLAVFFDF